MPIINLSNLQQFTAVKLLSDGGSIPGPVRIPSCAEIRLLWALEDGKVATNVMHGRYVGGFHGTVAEATAIHTGLSTGSLWTNLATMLAATTSLIRVDIKDVNTIDNAYISSTSAGQAGTSVSPALPNEVALAARLTTAKAGKANRGRMYVPGWATNALGTGNVAAATAVNNLRAWADSIRGVFSAQGYTLVIGQKARQAYTGSTGTAHPAREAGSIDVVSLIVPDNHWDSQRRRGLK